MLEETTGWFKDSVPHYEPEMKFEDDLDISLTNGSYDFILDETEIIQLGDINNERSPTTQNSAGKQ